MTAAAAAPPETFADLLDLPGVGYVYNEPVLEVLDEVVRLNPSVDLEALLRLGATIFRASPGADLVLVRRLLSSIHIGTFLRLWQQRPPTLKPHELALQREVMPRIAGLLAPRIERASPPTVALPAPLMAMRVGVLRRRLARYWPEQYREFGSDLAYTADTLVVGDWLALGRPQGPEPASREALELLGERLVERLGEHDEAAEARLLASEEDRPLLELLKQQLSAPPPAASVRAAGTWSVDAHERRVTLELPAFEACLKESCERVSCSFVNPTRPTLSCQSSRTPCAFKRLLLTRIAAKIRDEDDSDPALNVALRGLVRADTADVLLARLSALSHLNEDAPEGAQVGWLLTPPDRLEVVWLSEKKRGGLKTKRVPKGQVRAVLTRPNHLAALALLEARPSGRAGGLDVVGPALAILAHERALYVAGDEPRPLRVAVHEPRLAPVVEADRMRFQVALGPVRLDEEPEVGDWLLVMQGQTAHVGVVSEALASGMQLVRGLDAVPLTPAARVKVSEGLLALSERVPLQHDASWLGRRRSAGRRWVLKVELSGPRTKRTALVELGLRIVDELGVLTPGEGAETLPVRDVLGVGHVMRDFASEYAEARGLLTELGLSPAPGTFYERLEAQEDALAVVARALGLAQAGRLELAWAGTPVQLKASRGVRGVSVRIGVGRDWLDITGGYHLDGSELPLRELLDALREQKRFVMLDAHTMLELDEELRRSLTPLTAMTRAAAGKLVASPLAAPLVGELERVGVEVEGPPEWLEMSHRLDAAAASEPALPPLEATLRPYQVEGFAWAMRLAAWARGACLADDMGLGKTLQALAVVAARAGAGPTLVLAPTSVVPNWVREAGRFTPQLKVRRVLQGALLGEALLGLGPWDVLVTSWDLLVRHQARLATVAGEDGVAGPWTTLVLDEAQAMKNPSTRRARAVREVERAFALALTGTPVENRPLELWSLMSVVAPGLLGSMESFDDRFAAPIELGVSDAARQLARLVRPFILRRTKAEVARDLPDKTEIRVDVALTPDERERYRRLRQSAIRAIEKEEGDASQRAIRMLTVLTRLRQLACHPRLVEPDAPATSSKLTRLVELAEELARQGRKMLVFSQFTELLGLVRAAFDQAGLTWTYLDGATPGPAREAAIERFQSGAVDAFLLSLKAGGVGLNLTTATEVIHLDPWWNPAVEDQASDRAYRIGQDKPVTVYRMVALDTIEEQILTLHADKRTMVASLLEGTDRAAPLTSDELMALLMGDD